ncbi:hypothetical protein BH012_13070 [Salmonella enterica]|nr:hypothetical protein [Salmonella enterica]
MRQEKILHDFFKQYPYLTKNIEKMRTLRGGKYPNWPRWCFLPYVYWKSILLGNHSLKQTCIADKQREILDRFLTLGTWRYSQGIYTFHPDFLTALTETSIDGILPSEVFHRLPEWCVYVKTPGLTWLSKPLHGFWVQNEYNIFNKLSNLHILLDSDYERQTSWRFRTDNSTVVDIINTEINNLIDAGDSIYSDVLKVKEIRDYYVMNKSELLKKLLAIVLYLCSDEPEIDDARMPGVYPKYPDRVKTKKGFRLFPATSPRYWRVGESIGQVLSQTNSEHVQIATGSTGRHVRAHLRRGHWHGFWSGKKDEPEQRKFSYHWLPPQLVAGK